MDATAILSKLKDLGIEVTVRGDKLRLEPGSRVPHDLALEIQAQKPLLLSLLGGAGPQELSKEIAWRVQAMRSQIPRRGGIPFLVARSDLQGGPLNCSSCGDPLGPGNRYRCALCVQAAWQALRQAREEQGDAP